MGFLDAMGTFLSSIGAPGTPGHYQVVLNQTLILFTMIVAYVCLGTRYNWKEVASATVIFLGAAVSVSNFMEKQENRIVDKAGAGLGDLGSSLGKSLGSAGADSDVPHGTGVVHDANHSEQTQPMAFASEVPNSDPHNSSHFEKTPAEVSAIATLIYLLSNVPMAFSNVYKELGFRDLKLDVWTMTCVVVCYQTIITFFLLIFQQIPYLSGGPKGINLRTSWTRFVEGTECFLGDEIGHGVDCSAAGVMLCGYVVANLTFNCLSLQLTKQGASLGVGAVLCSLAYALKLPLSNIVFSQKAIMGADAESFSINSIVGLFIVVGGFLAYLYYSSEPEDEESEFSASPSSSLLTESVEEESVTLPTASPRSSEEGDSATTSTTTEWTAVPGKRIGEGSGSSSGSAAEEGVAVQVAESKLESNLKPEGLISGDSDHASGMVFAASTSLTERLLGKESAEGSKDDSRKHRKEQLQQTKTGKSDYLPPQEVAVINEEKSSLQTSSPARRSESGPPRSPTLSPTTKSSTEMLALAAVSSSSSSLAALSPPDSRRPSRRARSRDSADPGDAGDTAEDLQTKDTLVVIQTPRNRGRRDPSERRRSGSRDLSGLRSRSLSDPDSLLKNEKSFGTISPLKATPSAKRDRKSINHQVGMLAASDPDMNYRLYGRSSARASRAAASGRSRNGFDNRTDNPNRNDNAVEVNQAVSYRRLSMASRASEATISAADEEVWGFHERVVGCDLTRGVKRLNRDSVKMSFQSLFSLGSVQSMSQIREGDEPGDDRSRSRGRDGERSRSRGRDGETRGGRSRSRGRDER